MGKAKGKGNAAFGIGVPISEKYILILAVLELVLGLGSIAYFLYVIIGKPFVTDDKLKNLNCVGAKYTDFVINGFDLDKFKKFVDGCKLWNLLYGLIWLVRGLVALCMGAVLFVGLKSKNRTFLLANMMCSLAQIIIVFVSYIFLRQIEERGFLIVNNIFYELLALLLFAGTLSDVKSYVGEMQNGGSRANQKRNPNAVYGMPPPSSQSPHPHPHSPNPSPGHNETPKLSTTGEAEEPVTDPSEPAPPKEDSKGKKSKKKKGKKGSKPSKKSKKSKRG